MLACVAWRFCWAGRRSGVAARKISCFKLLPPQSPRGFSALARLYYLARPTKTAMLRRLGAGTLLYKPHRYVPPQRVGFLRRFGLKTGVDFAHFDLESVMVFEEITGMYERIYPLNFKWIRKKEKYANSKWILRNLVCWRSNLSNDDIFLRGMSENGYGFKKPGLKTGVKNDIFWSERGSGFGEPGGTPPPRIPRSTPPPEHN